MKLFYIFLDIDGVLNSKKYWDECFSRHHIKCIMSLNYFPFDPRCLNNLMKLNQELQRQNYEVNIILTSTWRLNKINIEIVNSRLAEYGMTLTDKTTQLDNNRGLEIKEFLKNQKYGNTDKFLIIDDNVTDISEIFEQSHIIHTNFETGFDEGKLQEAIWKGAL